MSLGFDRRNLDAAVARIVQLAKEKRQETVWVASQPKKQYLLADPEQVREYLMTWAEDALTDAHNLLTGRIVGVPYYSIGVVFEANLGEMHPAPLSRSPGKPERIAMFWQVL